MSIPNFIQYLQNQLRYSEHTIIAYRKDLDEFQYFLQQTEPDLALEAVEKIHVRNFIIHLSESGMKANTINRKISSMKRYYTFLLKEGKIEKHPASTIKNLKQEKKVLLPFSESEMNLLTENYDKSTYATFQQQLIIEVLYQTGIRKSELIGITMDKFSKQNQQIKVLGKRNKERIIPLSQELTHSLSEFLEYKHNHAQHSSYLFSLENGKKLYPKFVYNLVKQYLSRTTLKERKGPHMLRHTFATHILRNGAEINSVKELLGHSSLASTQVYTHQDIEGLKKVFQENHPKEKNSKN